MSKYNWTRQETKDLITLYEINECLWNKNLREYKDRDERVSSIQSISDEMKISIEEINKKIHNLRNQYRFELNKMKKNIPGKPRYQTKWPYFTNLSFLENIVSVRGSINPHNNTSNGDYSEANEYTVEKYEVHEDNSSDDKNVNGEQTTIVTATGANNSQPQQIFHVSVEYEEEAKPKTKAEILQNGRKRRLVTKDGIEIKQQPSTSTMTKQAPTIIIDEKSQDQSLKDISCGESEEKAAMSRSDEAKKSDPWDVFGVFIASELRSLSSPNLQKKLKRKILECILEINDQDSSHFQS